MRVYEVELVRTWKVYVRADCLDDAAEIALEGVEVEPEELSIGVTGVWLKHSHD
jgi:hypothetical protein